MMNFKPLCATIIAVQIATLLGGCMVGPDFVKPDPKPPEAWRDHVVDSSESHPTNAAALATWWKIFDDPILNGLVDRAAAQNLDIQVAASRLQQSRWQRRIVSSAGLPSIGANASAQRMGASENGLMSLTGVGSQPPASSLANGVGNGNAGISGADISAPMNLYQYGFDASWELDIWGKTRRSVEAADALTSASDETRHGVILAVLSETASNYVQLRTVQATLKNTTETLGLVKHSLELTQARQKAGATTSLEVSEAAAQVQAVSARIPDLESQEDKLINALSLLVAAEPGALADELETAKPIPPVPSEVPMGLPSELAKRRPDIREAEARLHAATAGIGAAKADFYPSVTLSGSFGMQSLNFATLGTWAARQFAIGPTLNLPIFQGGRLTGMLHLREAQQQEAALEYQKTVLGAWHEIDDALIDFDARQRKRKNLASALDHSRAAYDAAIYRYKAGASTFLDVLVLQQALLDAQTRWVSANGDVSLTAIRLFNALGGGWETDSAVSTVSSTSEGNRQTDVTSPQ
ncbi:MULTISPECIES: efflux transporter outer membrane subunit [Burkholderiaceae]|uniref:Secretion protein n=1 Tax=Caballeronia zhejiangensis TaxID=871203 RepID=A0A656QAX7_9BURK|nr:MULTISPECIES: TolC family protein [Burkholderiaceae]KAK43544.1 secretion protein [Caballeronia jiangsuensis]KDR26101.1 secretion protein [Caballeronia zhejiangensis]KWU24285.1 secretion protein [Burkholderia cenocepacia]SAL77650.1 RND efflux system outer membrane lipoprotein [Caballeronia peredens]